MDSLWLSCPADPDIPALLARARDHLGGRFPPGVVGDAGTVLGDLLHHSPGPGELILSHRDGSLLIELLTGNPPPCALPRPLAPGWRTGTHAAGAGSVVWAALTADGSRPPGYRDGDRPTDEEPS